MSGASPATMASHRTLLGWLDDPVAGRGVRVATSGSGWDRWSWGEIAHAANAAAAQISEQARGRTGAVAIIAPNGVEFVAAFYGALLAGLIPCPLAPPKPLDDPERYREHLQALLASAQPVAIVTVDEYEQTLAQIPAAADHVTLTAQRSAETFARPRAAELGLLQFTSGSSGRPRPVRVTRENLEANLRAIQQLVGIDPEADEVVTWLPTYHDLGLIGCTLVPAATQVAMNMLRIEEFVMRPERWLSCLGAADERSTLTGSPPFGLGYALKRVPQETLEQLDFSRWRFVIMGAERIDAALLARVIERFGARGLSPSALVPAYGLAEATLLVSAKHGQTPARAVRPDWSRAAFGRTLALLEQISLDERARVDDGAGWLVGCGTKAADVDLTVIDEDGEQLGEGMLGEVVIGGASVADGYLGDAEASRERFGEGRLRSGDAGFLLDGELFVVGRIANALKVDGSWLFVEDVELAVMSSGLVDRGRCVVFSGTQATGDEIVVLVEREPGEWAAELGTLLSREVPNTVGVRVLAAARGSIARTSSGKPRRALLWAQHLSGELNARTALLRAAGHSDWQPGAAT